MKSFMCLQCDQGYKNGKLITKTFPNTFLQTPNSTFCRSVNRA